MPPHNSKLLAAAGQLVGSGAGHFCPFSLISTHLWPLTNYPNSRKVHPGQHLCVLSCVPPANYLQQNALMQAFQLLHGLFGLLPPWE